MIFILILHFLNSLLYYLIMFYKGIRLFCIILSLLISSIAYSREVLIFKFNMHKLNIKR